MDFKTGDRVFSVYEDVAGTICDVIPTIGQTHYIVKWDTGKVAEVAREEIY